MLEESKNFNIGELNAEALDSTDDPKIQAVDESFLQSILSVLYKGNFTSIAFVPLCG